MKHTRKFAQKLTACAFSTAVWVMILALAAPLWAQVVSVEDDFNDRSDLEWTHYPGSHNLQGNNGQTTWDFPPDGVGGFAYHLFQEAPTDDGLGPARMGSFRADAVYADFFTAADYVNWDDTVAGNWGAVVARVPNLGAPPLNGYLVTYVEPGPSARLSQFINLRFISEAIDASIRDQYNGGVAIVGRLDKSRRYRVVFTGSGPFMRGAIYDPFDLLEPIAKNAFRDETIPSGAAGLAIVNGASTDRPADWTFDNYFSSGDSANFIGYPGTPQVVDLTPAPQTLFYSPGAPSMAFKLRTFTTNQINTNSVRLVLNGADVTAQLTITDDGGIVDPPRTRYAVTFNGTLNTDTIYNGRIIVNDTAGKGTTNNWVFDTFQTFDEIDPGYSSGRVIIEAEDYNYGGGQFQEAPLVSGKTPDGVEVGGTGVFDGYYKTIGVNGVDYFDRRTSTKGTNPGDPDPSNNEYYSSYRADDFVGTFQDRWQTGDTPREKHIAANVPDYVVWQMQNGEWLNYTRTFPNNTYHVYLRVSSQAAQPVMMDEVASDPSQPDQITCLRGVFRVPNTGSSTRFRYVPLTDGLGRPIAIALDGIHTLRLTAPQARTEGELGDLQFNYMMFVPASSTASGQPWISSASPGPGDDNVQPEVNVQITILDRETAVDTASIRLSLDGTDVTGSATIASVAGCSTGVSITYSHPTVLPPRSTHTLRLVFADNGAPIVTQDYQWSFTIRDMLTLPSAWAHSGLTVERGFKVQVHKAPNSAPGTDFPNSAERAERQLNNQIIDPNTNEPYPNEAAGANGLGVYGESSGLNYEQGGGGAGHIGGDNLYPGIPPSDANHIALAGTAYLELAPGAYRFGGFSDDGFVVTAGPDLPGTNLLVGTLPDCCIPVEFDFWVETAGLYAFRFLHWEGFGGAFAEFYAVNRRTGERTLINDLYSSSSIRAYRLPGDDLNLPVLPASFAAPLGSGVARGLAVQIHKARNDAPESDFPNTSDRAERQLADQIIDPFSGMPYFNEADPGVFNVAVVNYHQDGTPIGFVGGDTAFPGIDPALYNNDPDFIAMAATGYLELAAGHHRMGVHSDDGFKVTSGPTPPETNFLAGIFEGGRGPSPTEFEFVVSSAGLYPFRLLYYEGRVEASVEWYSVNLGTGERIAINADHPNAVRAYRAVGYRLINPRVEGGTFQVSFRTVADKVFILEYKNSLNDPDWLEAGFVVGDGTEQTLSDPASTATRFYRLRVE